MKLFYDLLTRHHLIPEIILDELFWDAWKTMHERNTLTETQLGRLHEAIEDMKPTTAREILQLKLLRLLLHLNEGESCTTHNDLGTTETPLEAALVIYEDLLESCPTYKSEFWELELKIVTQAIYVSCRNNNFELAQKIAERHSMRPSQNGSDNVENENIEEIQRQMVQWDIQEVVDAADCHHHKLEGNSYSEFCKFVLQKLQFLVDSLHLQKKELDEVDGSIPIDSNEKDLMFQRNIMKTLLHMKIERWCPEDHVDLWIALREHGMSDSYDEKVVAVKVKSALERLNLLQEIKKVHLSKN